MNGRQKKVVIIAGPNGAGKTTFARAFLPNEAGCPHFINADLIAAGLSPFAPERAAVRAGRIMLDKISRSAAEGRTFAFETTLAGLAYARRIAQWRGEGYTVKLIFLKLSSVGRHWRGWRCGFDKVDTTCRLASCAGGSTPAGAISRTSTDTAWTTGNVSTTAARPRYC